MGASLKTKTVSKGEYQGAIRLGVKGERGVYWHIPSNTIVKFQSPSPSDSEIDETVCLSEPVGNYILNTDRGGGCWDFSPIAKFFRGVSSFDGVKILTAREEEIYGISRFTNIPAEEAADMLGISLSTYGGVEGRAQKKVTCALNLVDAVTQ